MDRTAFTSCTITAYRYGLPSPEGCILAICLCKDSEVSRVEDEANPRLNYLLSEREETVDSRCSEYIYQWGLSTGYSVEEIKSGRFDYGVVYVRFFRLQREKIV